MQTAVTQSHHQLSLQVNPHLVTFCTVAVFLYALTRLWIGAKISAYFEAAFLLPFYYIVFKNWWYFKKQFLTWLVIAMLAVPVLQFCVQYYQDPVLAMKYQGVDKLFRLTFFLAPAFWLAHNLKLVPWFIAANLVGLMILLSMQDDLAHQFNSALAGSRISWGAINPQFAAMYAGIGFITTLSLYPLLSKNIKNTLYRNTCHAVLLLALITVIFILYATQTRAVIGGLVITLISAVVLLMAHQHISVKHLIKKPTVIIITFTILFGLAGALNQETLSYKLKKDWQGITINNESIIPNKLGGGRGELWKFGVNKTIENPLAGYGGESRKDLITNENTLSKRTKGYLWHFHNSWVEFGVAYGLLGAALLSILFFLVLLKTIKAWNQIRLPSPIALFTILTLVFTCFINLFESYLFFWQGGYLLVWCYAPAFAYHINSKLTDAKWSSPASN